MPARFAPGCRTRDLPRVANYTRRAAADDMSPEVSSSTVKPGDVVRECPAVEMSFAGGPRRCAALRRTSEYTKAPATAATATILSMWFMSHGTARRRPAQSVKRGNARELAPIAGRRGAAGRLSGLA